METIAVVLAFFANNPIETFGMLAFLMVFVVLSAIP